MKRIIHVTFALLLGALFAPTAGLAAEGTSVRAILITASNEKGPSDPRLAAYEQELQRNLVFSTFKFVNEGAANVPPRGHTTINLGRHRVELEAERSAEGPIRVKVQWMNDGKLEIATTLSLQPGIPAVLIRRRDEAQVPVILLFAR
jgi:hypothetical protein